MIHPRLEAEGQRMIWMNVDIPNQYCMIHEESCNFVRQVGAAYKGVDDLRRDGRWLRITCEEEVLSYQDQQHCKRCK
jgi:hypothetical protein